MCDWNNGGIVIKLPDNICEWKQNRTVCIDDCMVHIIKELWKQGYETLACCCGHNKDKPNIVIADAYKDEEIKAIKEIIKSVGDREMAILQWRLVEV